MRSSEPDGIGLSGVLTMVCYAMTVARTAPERTPAPIRIPCYAVWETVVFVLNILAFIFIGLQIRPILDELEPSMRGCYGLVAVAVLLTGLVVRFACHMSFNAVIRWRDRRTGFHVAAALALPAAFPYRDLIVLTAFAVVVGTLVLRGLTLKPLLRALDLKDDDAVGHEVASARDRALQARLATLDGDRSSHAEAVRQEFIAHLRAADAAAAGRPSTHTDIHRAAIQAARQAVLAMRASDEIGDDAFHQIEEELDWLEMAGGGKDEHAANDAN